MDSSKPYIRVCRFGHCVLVMGASMGQSTYVFVVLVRRRQSHRRYKNLCEKLLELSFAFIIGYTFKRN